MTGPGLEFTGERVVPGQVDRQLFAEHVARYQYAVQALSEYPAGTPLLELACGTGYGTAMLAEAGFATRGIDLSPEAIAFAREHFGLDYSVGDVTATGEPDRSTPLVVAFEILEHLPEPEALLREIARILAPGGTALISTPNVDTHPFAGKNEFHTREYTLAEFRALCEQHFPTDQITLTGQVQSGVAGSQAIAGLRKGYLGLKRALGIGPLLKKAQIEWDPSQSLLDFPHPYRFDEAHPERGEYVIARIRRPA